MFALPCGGADTGGLGSVREDSPVGGRRGESWVLEEDVVEIWPGTAYPLGATYDGTGTNFALVSEVADRVQLCLFDDAGTETRIDLTEVDGFIWHCFLPAVGPGQRPRSATHG